MTHAKKNLTSTGLEPATPRWLPSKDRRSKSGTLSIAPTGSHQPESTILCRFRNRDHTLDFQLPISACSVEDWKREGENDAESIRIGPVSIGPLSLNFREFYTGGQHHSNKILLSERRRGKVSWPPDFCCSTFDAFSDMGSKISPQQK